MLSAVKSQQPPWASRETCGHCPRAHMRRHLSSALALFLIHSLCYYTVQSLPQKSSIRRQRLLRPEFGNSLSLLHSSFLPQGEVADRISGNERIRRLGGITGRTANRLLPDRHHSITSKAAAAVGAGIASVAGRALDSPLLAITNKATQKPRAIGVDTSRVPKAAQSQCSRAAQQLFDVISNGFNASVSNSTRGHSSRSSRSSSANFLAQSGYIDFGLAGSQDSQAPCQPNCAFSNPTSSYGLTVLPLNPGENVTAKVTDDHTPGYVKQNLDGRFGPGAAPTWQLQQDEVVVLAGCTPPQEASRYFGVTGYLYSTYNTDSSHWIDVFASLGDSASIATISTAAAAAATTWQQQQQQQDDRQQAAPSKAFQISSGRLNTSKPISNSSSSSKGSSSSSNFGALAVVLLGANPNTVAAAADQIRGSITAAAAQLHDAVSNGSAARLHSAGSVIKPDFINIIPIPGPIFSDAIGLNSTSNYYSLIVRNMAPSGAEGSAAFQGYVEQPHLMAWRLTPVNHSSSSSSSSYAGNSGNSSNSSSGITAHSSSSSNGTYGLPVVIRRDASGRSSSQQDVYLSITSNKSSSSARDYTAANSIMAMASADGGVDGVDESSSGASSSSNAPHTTGCGSVSSTMSPACLLHAHVAGAVAAGVSDAISKLLIAQPAVAASLRNTGYDANDTSDRGPPVTTTTSSSNSSSSSSSSGNGTRASGSNVTSSSAGLGAISAVVKAASRNKTASAEQHLQVLAPSLQQQEVMLDLMLTAIDLQYNSSYAIAHGLGSAAPLALLGVDWGVDCVIKTLDWCNGDNRDATYLSSLPLFTLNRPGQLLLVVGVNYVSAGVGSYMNVAVTDPVQQLGLEAFDDAELTAAAVPWPTAALAVPGGGGSHSSRASSAAASAVLPRLLYLVAFSRNCTGVNIPCKEIALGGHPRGAPLTRPLMTISRVYVNPATGVGPDPRDLVPFMTLVLTPKAVALPADSVPRTDMGTWTHSVEAGFDASGRPSSSSPYLDNATLGHSNSSSRHQSSSGSSNIHDPSKADSRDNAVAATAAAGSDAGRARLSSGYAGLSNLSGLPGRGFTSQSVPGLQRRQARLPVRARRRWSNAKGDFDPAAAAQATQCPANQQAAVANGTADVPYNSTTGTGSVAISGTAADSADGSRNVMVQAPKYRDGANEDSRNSMPQVDDAVSLARHADDPNVHNIALTAVTTSQAATEPCVRSLVGISQCSGKGSPDVCCSYVQAWNDQDCWCQDSGRMLLSSMPAVLTPSVLQLLSWVCEAQ